MQMVERVISDLPEKPIVVRLSGHAQTDDRLAMRETAWQLAQQTGTSLMPLNEDEDEEDEFDLEEDEMEAAAFENLRAEDEDWEITERGACIISWVA